MTIHRMPAPGKIELDGIDAIVPCCGRRGSELPDGDTVALPGTLGEANVDCTGSALIMAGPPPTTRTPQEIERMDADERKQLAATEEEQEAAELAAMRERVQTGSNDLGKYAEELVRARKLNLLDLVLTEMRVRLDVLSDAAFGDGSADQFGYELTVQQQCRTRFTEMASAAEQVRGAVEAEQRKAALLKGVTVQARAPGGRP